MRLSIIAPTATALLVSMSSSTSHAKQDARHMVVGARSLTIAECLAMISTEISEEFEWVIILHFVCLLMSIELVIFHYNVIIYLLTLLVHLPNINHTHHKAFRKQTKHSPDFPSPIKSGTLPIPSNGKRPTMPNFRQSKNIPISYVTLGRMILMAQI